MNEQEQESGITTVSRNDAVVEIAAAYKEGTAYLVTAGPLTLPTVLTAVTKLPGWVMYADAGTGEILRNEGQREVAWLLATADQVNPGNLAAMFTVPRTVPREQLSEVIGQDISEQQVLIIAVGEDEQEQGLIPFPQLFVDAVGHADPALKLHLLLAQRGTMN